MEAFTVSRLFNALAVSPASELAAFPNTTLTLERPVKLKAIKGAFYVLIQPAYLLRRSRVVGSFKLQNTDLTQGALSVNGLKLVSSPGSQRGVYEIFNSDDNGKVDFSFPEGILLGRSFAISEINIGVIDVGIAVGDELDYSLTFYYE